MNKSNRDGNCAAKVHRSSRYFTQPLRKLQTKDALQAQVRCGFDGTIESEAEVLNGKSNKILNLILAFCKQPLIHS